MLFKIMYRNTLKYIMLGNDGSNWVDGTTKSEMKSLQGINCRD